MNEHFDATENFVTIQEGEWSFQDQRGRVEASIPIRCVPSFSELAVLAFPGATACHFAARIIHTDDWAHFQYLQHWMQPIVQEYLTASSRYSRIVELVAETHRLAQ